MPENTVALVVTYIQRQLQQFVGPFYMLGIDMILATRNFSETLVKSSMVNGSPQLPPASVDVAFVVCIRLGSRLGRFARRSDQLVDLV